MIIANGLCCLRSVIFFFLQMTKGFISELAESVRHRQHGVVVPGPSLMLTLR